MTPTTTLTPRAACLLALLARRPRTWSEPRAAGLSAAAVLAAVDELLGTGAVRVRLGPVLVELECGPEDEEGPS